MREASFKRFVSSLGSGTSVLDIPRPIVSIYTHRHTIENFEILNFFGFDCHHLRGVGFWSQFFCAFGCTYLCLLGVKTCSGPFRSICKQKSILGMKLCFKLRFWPIAKTTSFWTILPPVGVSKRHFGPLDRAFWVVLEPQICIKMAKKGF